MHWHWGTCPVVWKGHFTWGNQEILTIMLDVVASVDLWVWYAFFKVARSNNDILLDQSPHFNDILHKFALEIQFIMVQIYIKRYYFADGIYQSWATFVKYILYSKDCKRINLKCCKTLDKTMVSETSVGCNLSGNCMLLCPL